MNQKLIERAIEQCGMATIAASMHKREFSHYIAANNQPKDWRNV